MPLGFIETAPTKIASKLEIEKPADEDVIVQMPTDLDEDHTFGEQWFVVTSQRVLLIPRQGANGTVATPLSDVAFVRVDDLVGGGLIEIEKKDGTPVFIPFSQSLRPKFAEVAEGLKRLAEGESDKLELPTELDRTRCESCNRLLPEKNGTCPVCIEKWETFWRIVGYMTAYRGEVAVMLSLTVVGSLLGLVPPKVTQHIIDDVLTPSAGFRPLVWAVGALLGVRISIWCVDVSRRYIARRLGLKAIQDLREDLYRHFQFLPIRFYDRRRLGSLIARMTNDSDRLEGLMLYELSFVLSNGILFFGILGLLLWTNWSLTLYVLLPIPPIVYAGSRIWERMMRNWNLWGARWSKLYAQLNESITGIRVVKAFSQEAREGKRFDGHNEGVREVTVIGERNWFVFFTVTNFLMSCGAFFVWYFGGLKILENEMTLGALTAFVSYLWMMYQPLRWFGDFYNFMMRAFAGAKRIFEVIDSQAEPYEVAGAEELKEMEGRITFEDAYFGYDPGKPVLKAIRLDVEPGEMIGLVGKSGAGKSTLINLICRFYDPDRGAVRVDGRDMREITLRSLRSRIGMVQQEPFLFDGTVAENIAYGKPDATFDDVIRAAVAAEAHEFIVKKPDGYDMKVGERGGKLSGGEKQRISIARAILHDPKILILDEATSSLDTQTERKIQLAISRLVEGRTTFAIAHRLSTLRSANRLVVVDEGRVAEVGSHEELIERQGIFYRLVKTQQETTAVMEVAG